jgi:Tol biopolymer transport system component
MGDVYHARDTRLGRDVAVKTIKGPFTERFEREARAISSLSHPNICTLFDVGEHDGAGYLVMEHVEGKPIAGPLPVEQAITYAIQICEALHAAHRKGVIHRDLKPANILVTKQGIKLLDFGLAKLDVTSVGSSNPDVGSAAERATIAALTGAHTVVGTPQYMSPEQIEAGQVDARSDIFAFGCVLYELLTGQRAFEGKTPSSVMAAILASKPRPFDQLVPLAPPALERVVMRCLEKDPEDRWQTARDVAAELQWVAQGGSRVGLPAVITTRRRVRERLAWTACAVATLTAIAFAIAWARRAPTPPPVVRFAMPVPDGLTSVGPSALSPDGRLIAFDGADAGGRREIWIRALDALEARPLAGTEGTGRPFWSPDSKQLAFFSSGKLKRVAVSGGSPQTICDSPRGSDGTWGSDGTILFDGGPQDPIWRVSAAGGVAQTIVSVPKETGVVSVGWPEFLPDGRHFLYGTFGVSGSDQTVMIGALDSSERKRLLTTTSRVQYAAPGFLLYVRDQTLVAHPFDPDAREFEGEPIPVGEGLGVDAVGLASFSVSRNGVLAFRAGEGSGHQLVWVDRTGKETPAMEGTGQYRDAWLSPDGTRLVFEAVSSEGSDLWIRDLVRGVTSRFTFDPEGEHDPIWSPDGSRIVFTARKEGGAHLFVKDASGAREAELLLKTGEEKFAADWTRDGAYVLFASRSPAGWDLWALPLAGERKPFPLAKTRFNELFGTVSPDGKYLAYFSDESGQFEVYVQEFPQPQNKWQVSANGGRQPFWSADGRALYFRDAVNTIMTVPVETGATFKAGISQKVVQTRFAAVTARAHYRPARDGRFLVLAPAGTETVNPTSVVLNWTTAIRN